MVAVFPVSERCFALKGKVAEGERWRGTDVLMETVGAPF